MKPKQMEIFVDDKGSHWLGSFSDGGTLRGFKEVPKNWAVEWEEEGIEVIYYDKPKF